jgi:tocopherol cyclase
VFKTSRYPDLYHGQNKKSNFFEGWYFKLADPSGRFTYCLIPGIILAENEDYSHSFIQFLDGKNSKFRYIKFAEKAFKAHSTKFDISISSNRFSLHSLQLDIDEKDLKIYGHLTFSNIKHWPDNLLNPGSMGFYNYLTFMQCYSQVCSMSSCISGILNINGQNIDFTGGRAYIEKNWGKAFPYSYIWIQSNSFEDITASLTCSIAHIPFPLGSFTGFLIGFYFRDKFYKFTTINKSYIKLKAEIEQTEITVSNKRYSLSITAQTFKDKFMDLYAPRDDKMIPIARETLQGKVIVRLTDIKSGEVLFNDEGLSAGVEFSGDYTKLCN